MTDKEQEIRDCLDKVNAYCLEHKGSCEGCIFFSSVSVGDRSVGMCRVTYAPDIFGQGGRQ